MLSGKFFLPRRLRRTYWFTVDFIENGEEKEEEKEEKKEKKNHLHRQLGVHERKQQDTTWKQFR